MRIVGSGKRNSKCIIISPLFAEGGDHALAGCCWIHELVSGPGSRPRIPRFSSFRDDDDIILWKKGKGLGLYYILWISLSPHCALRLKGGKESLELQSILLTRRIFPSKPKSLRVAQQQNHQKNSQTSKEDSSDPTLFFLFLHSFAVFFKNEWSVF